tara:strand:+ start:2290 stop:3336 length:1047 start_codon:yes stop_codon:yes gene_type:complete
MKFYKLFFIILTFFLKTETIISDENIFYVNNIKLVKEANISNEELTNRAITKGFKRLGEKILLTEDIKKLTILKQSQIKDLVSYYQIITENDGSEKSNSIIYNIYFDKDKIHDLFFNLGIFYSEITNKEFYLLPILKKNDQLFIYNKNYFYQNWNSNNQNEIIEFILLLENIEVIQKINLEKENLMSLNLKEIFKEYSKNNYGIVLIDISNPKREKIYLNTQILGKNISKSLNIQNIYSNKEKYYEKLINEISLVITNLVKSQNLIDVRTPSFLNVKFKINKRNNLEDLNKRIKKIDAINNMYVQELNKDFVLIKLKYLGKLSKIISQLKKDRIILEQRENEWSLKII